MKVVIDTCSLLSLVRYYLPFDSNSVLFKFIRGKIENGEFIIIDKVYEECSYNAKGIVIKTLPYLNDKVFLKLAKVPTKTNSLIAPSTKQFLHLLNNVFVNQTIKKQKGLTDAEFENQKASFLENADMKQIILCLHLLEQNEKVILVTEETENNNDNKLFKKIPSICNELNIQVSSLPSLLKRYNININFQ